MTEDNITDPLTFGEFVRYQGKPVRIGVKDKLYYTSYQKYVKNLGAGQLGKVPGYLHPQDYAKVDSGFRFRFPFPDELELPLGSTGDFDFFRGLSFEIDIAKNKELNAQLGGSYYCTWLELEIVQQQLVSRSIDGRPVLALVVRNNDMGCLNKIEEKSSIENLVRQIYKHHIMEELDEKKLSLYRGVALQILKGYGIKMPPPGLTTRLKNIRGRRLGLGM